MNDEISKAVRMVFGSHLCPECRRGPVPSEAKFCPHCGCKLPDLSIVDQEYRNLNGYWLVSTEDPKEDGKWIILGVHEGNVVEIAYAMMDLPTRTLQFKAMPKPYRRPDGAPNSVEISFPVSTGLARTDRGSRARLVRSLVDLSGVDGVQVIESAEYAAVRLVFPKR